MLQYIYKLLLLLLVMNRNGVSNSLLAWILWAGIVVSIFAVIIVNATNLGLPGFDLSGAPDGARMIVDSLIKVVSPFVEALFFIVAPSGQDENVQMIAFSIFLLLVLVGTRTLRLAFGQGTGKRYAFFISVIVGLIAARSLTATLLKDTALAASPIAVVSLLLGFIPIFALTRNLDRLNLTNFSKMAVFTVTSLVYFFVFWFGFEALVLGAVYGAGIALIGLGEAVFRVMAPHMEENQNKKTGQFIAWAGKVEETAKQMRHGAEEAAKK